MMRRIAEIGLDVVPASHVVFGFVGSFYVREFNLPAGVAHGGHAHFIDHATFIAKGKVSVAWHDPATNESGCVVVEAPNFIPIAAQEIHEITALDDATWYCIFSEAEGEKVAGSETDLWST